MANFLTRRLYFWKQAFYSKVMAAVSILITAFTILLIIRDGVVDPKNRDWFLLKFVPNLPWYWWLVIGVLCLLFLALEGAYDVHKSENAKLLSKHRQRVRQLEEKFRVGEIHANTLELVAATRGGAQPTKQKKVAQNNSIEHKARLTVLDCDAFGFELSPRGMISKANKDSKVAVVEFYRETDDTSHSWIEVRAHIEFYDLEGNRLARVNDGFWHKEHEELTQLAKFKVGDSRSLVIASNTMGATVVFGGRLREHRIATTYINEFIPDFNISLDGKDHLVRVRLLSLKVGRSVLDETLNFRLSTDPTFTITPIARGEGTTLPIPS